MSESRWHSFLQTYNREILKSEFLADVLQNIGDDKPGLDAAVRSGWLGTSGATGEQIAQAERRLGATLPASYRTFLMQCNGWHLPGIHVPRLWSVEELDWFSATDPETIDAWSEGDPETGAELAKTLRISDLEIAGSALYLLHPGRVGSGGEWEAWLFAHWIPGADAYPSFQALMEAERQRFLRYEEQQSKRMKPSDGLQDISDKLPNLMQALEDKARQYRQFAGGGPGASMASEQTAEGLEEVADRVRQLQLRRLDPQTLQVLLHVLKQEMTQQHMRAHERWVRRRTPLDRLRPGEGARALSRAEGIRQGAALIGWFLEGTAPGEPP